MKNKVFNLKWLAFVVLMGVLSVGLGFFVGTALRFEKQLYFPEALERHSK
jgi:hypothetical protein